MNDQRDEFDPRLEELFRREHAHLPAEPFASAALRRIAAERKRSAIQTRVLQAAALIASIALSPLLIAASIWVSARLDELFASVSGWLASPLGFAVAGVCVLAALGTKWARVW
jgi:hypothetical protein